MAAKIKRIYTRRYHDTGQCTAYVDWANGVRTEGAAEDYHGILLPKGVHLGAVFDRALNDGLKLEHEEW